MMTLKVLDTSVLSKTILITLMLHAKQTKAGGPYPRLRDFLVEYLATQTGGANVNNIFEVRFTYTKID